MSVIRGIKRNSVFLAGYEAGYMRREKEINTLQLELASMREENARLKGAYTEKIEHAAREADANKPESVRRLEPLRGIMNEIEMKLAGESNAKD